MLERYPEHRAGHRGRDTGEHAAELQNPSLQAVRKLVLSEFDNGPGSPEAIWRRLRERGHNIWFMTLRCRVSDLGKLGQLVDTGNRDTSMSGRAKSIVWRKATPEEFAQHVARCAAEAEKSGGHDE